MGTFTTHLIDFRRLGMSISHTAISEQLVSRRGPHPEITKYLAPRDSLLPSTRVNKVRINFSIADYYIHGNIHWQSHKEQVAVPIYAHPCERKKGFFR
jgi:hypothetical protein